MATTKKKNVTLPGDVLEEAEMANLDLKDTTVGCRIDDSVLIKVKSTCYGKLIYRNTKTGEETIWEHAGEIQIMSMGDLRAMKATQASFFMNNWIVILGVADGSDCSAKCADIYKTLVITKYYQDYVEPTDFRAILSWDEEKAKERMKMMSSTAKENLVVALNEYIRCGLLDSMRQIRMFEDALECQLCIAE